MSGSDFFNYKKCFSIILMAVVDARYKFSIIDVGAYGRECDSGIFGRTHFGRRLQSGTLDIPDQAVHPGSQETCPYVFVGDGAFPLQTHMVRSYPGHNIPRGQRIFNYRLSRARRISENGFGILAARWRIFQKPIEALPPNVDDIVTATVALHNYLKSSDAATVPADGYVHLQFVDNVGEDGSLRPGEWREMTRNDTNLLPVGRLGANRASREASRIRDHFVTYFQTNHGSIPWQDNVVDRTLPHESGSESN